MKKLKHKLGTIYWKMVGIIKKSVYHLKKTVRCIKNWMRGWFRGWTMGVARLEKVQSMVVCAHPDDETIFFSSILKSKKPFVVCCSNRGHKVRREEFEKTLTYWGVEGIMLNFPDVPGMTFVWKWRMAATLKKIRKKLPSAMTVYTHSASGESGHPHHYAVSNGVTKAFKGCRIITTAITIPESGEGRLTVADIEEKYSIIKNCYPSQINMLEKWCLWWQGYLTIEFFEE